MASIGSLVIDLLAKTGTFETDMGRAARTAEKRSKDIDRSISRMGSRIKGALTGLFVGFSFSKIIEETSKAEAALAKLDNAVKNNAGAAGASTAQLAEFSAELQRLTTFSDESVQEMQALLLSFRQIGGSEFERAQVAILDLATALGRDLNSSALLVGRALADPVKGMTALSRSGIVLAKDQKDLIKRLSETGRAAEAQQILLGELEKRFGGAAQAARNTFGGALAGLKNAFGDLLEAKGGLPEATAELNKLATLLADPKTKESADNLLTGIIKGGAALVPIIAGIVDGVRKLTGGATELEKLTEKLEFLEGQKDQVIPIVFQAGYLDGADNIILGRDAILAEIKRIKDEIDKVTNARSTLPAPPRRTSQSAGGGVPITTLPSEEFIKLSEKLNEQIALYGKVGEAAKISFQIQSGALDELSKSEQQQVLALAKQYDAVVSAATAQKQLQEAQKSSTEEITKMVASLEQQVAVFGLSEEAAIAYRIAQGDLAATFSAAGAAADPLKAQLIALTAEYERLAAAATAAKEAEAAQAEIEREVAEIYESTRTPLEKFNAEIERLNELRNTGALDPATYERAAAAAQDAFEKAGKAVDSFSEQFKDATFKTLEDGIFTGITEGAEKGWKGFLDAGLNTINRLVAAALAKQIAEGLFGGESTGAGGGGGGQWGWVSKVAGLFGGGRAYGGDVSAGSVYRVNEREPEFFRPNVSGKVIPLSKMAGGGGGGNTFAPVFNVRGDVTRRSAQQLAVDASRRQRIASARLG